MASALALMPTSIWVTFRVACEHKTAKTQTSVNNLPPAATTFDDGAWPVFMGQHTSHAYLTLGSELKALRVGNFDSVFHF